MVEAALRIITRLLTDELWRDDGFLSNARGASLSAEEVKNLLRAGGVHCVIANVGSWPQWTPPPESYRLWKSDVQLHLAEPDACVSLEDWQRDYVYFASHWGNDAGVPIIVLEKHH